jgi:hypothetical protein
MHGIPLKSLESKDFSKLVPQRKQEIVEVGLAGASHLVGDVPSHFGLRSRSQQLDIRKPFLKCAGVPIGTFKIAVGRIGDVAICSQQVLNPQLATSVDEVSAGRKSVGEHRREGGRKEASDDRERNGHCDPIIISAETEFE